MLLQNIENEVNALLDILYKQLSRGLDCKLMKKIETLYDIKHNLTQINILK
jgi:hypothetical protein